MVKLVKQLKLSLGAGTLGMAALFAAATYAFTSAFKSGIAGNEQLAFNIVIFPVLIGFLLAGYYQLVSRKFNSLMALAKKNEDEDLSKYLDNIAIIRSQRNFIGGLNKAVIIQITIRSDTNHISNNIFAANTIDSIPNHRPCIIIKS